MNYAKGSEAWKYAARWITIGGKKGPDGRSGGFPVQIDDDGRIVGGKRAETLGLHGTHVGDVKEHFDERRAIQSEGKDGGTDFDFGAESTSAKRKAAAASLPAKRTAIRERLIDAAGEDERDQASLYERMKSIVRDRAEWVREYNDQLDEFYGSRTAAQKLSLIGKLAKRTDPSKVEGFDTLLDTARRRYPALLNNPEAGGDEEWSLAEAIRSGKKRVPTINDDDVLEDALRGWEPPSEYVAEYDPELEAVPFANGSEAERYFRRWTMRPEAYGRQMALFGDARQKRIEWDEKKHPRDAGGQFTSGSGEASKSTPDTTPKGPVVSAEGPDITSAGPDTTKAAKTKSSGVEWVRAPAGGAVSDVNGKSYRGGQLMPIHGLSEKSDVKPSQKPKGDGVITKPNENAKKREPRKPMTPEQIEALKQEREEKAKWLKLKDGPLGRYARLGDRPGRVFGAGGIKPWIDFAKDLSPEQVNKIAEFAREMVIEQDKASWKGGPDNAKYPGDDAVVQLIDEQAARFAQNNIDMFPRTFTKKALAANPKLSLANVHLAEAVSNASFEQLFEINSRLESIVGESTKSAPRKASPKTEAASGAVQAARQQGRKVQLGGNTFAEKNFIKERLGGRWNPDAKAWEVSPDVFEGEGGPDMLGSLADNGVTFYARGSEAHRYASRWGVASPRR